AEIPTLQELQSLPKNDDGSYSYPEVRKYGERMAAVYAVGILLQVYNAPVRLNIYKIGFDLFPGAGGLKTLRLEYDFISKITPSEAGVVRRLSFEDGNHKDRIGWHEIVVIPSSDITIFNSSAFGNGLTDELLDYPQNMPADPLNERR